MAVARDIVSPRHLSSRCNNSCVRRIWVGWANFNALCRLLAHRSSRCYGWLVLHGKPPRSVMSLRIDSRYITGIYALNQWFNVKKDTVDVDSFEFTNWEEESPHDANNWNTSRTDYMMGAIYDKNQLNFKKAAYSEGSNAFWAQPGSCHGICFIDADTNERVTFSLLEVKGFREQRP